MRKRALGFTLIEMILVMVIIAMILYASIGYIQQRAQTARIDRTTGQMQQIMNAALAYYVANGTWPATLADLQTGYYLPTGTLNNPWGLSYQVKAGTATPAPPAFGSPPPILYVWTTIPQTGTTGSAIVIARSIANYLPLSFTTNSASSPPANNTACTTAMTTCKVVAQLNVPGQNLNNARAVNFAGLYHNGGCVPVPQCPIDTTQQYMTPEIMVVPVSVSGLNDSGSMRVYPISSFTAYATGPAANPPACRNSLSAPSCASNLVGSAASSYWRACLQVVTQKGDVQTSGSIAGTPATGWGANVTLMAITRCSVNGETAGSSFTVYSD